MSVTIVRPNIQHCPTFGDTVKVYWNFHKKMFSVMFKGRVAYHITDINLKDVRFVVRQSGREKVLREKKKNVHAFVVGKIATYEECQFAYGVYFQEDIQYNPYTRDSFYNVETDKPIYTAGVVALSSVNRKAYITLLKY